jgi:ketosteroid isomerase-like protein
MYRSIVARRVRSAWAHIDRRDYRYVIDQLAPGFEHSFAGDHAMGGTRRSRESLASWFERVFRLFPAIRFEVRDVLVRGMPWSTRAVALIRVSAGEVDGVRYENELAQTIDLRWGRIVRIHTLEDTQKLAGALERLHAGGVEEAAAERIEDRVPVP